MKLDVDDARLDDLSAEAWTGLAVALVVTAAGIWMAVTGDLAGLVLSGSTVLLAGVGLKETLEPEFDGVCETCGEHVYVNSARDGVDEVVIVRATGTPKRARVTGITGRLSVAMVMQRNKDERAYCSAECAHRDERLLIPHYGHDEILETPSTEASD